MIFFDKIKKYFKKEKAFPDLNKMDLGERDSYIEKLKISDNIDENIKIFKKVYGDSLDLNVRRFKMGRKEIKCALVYMSGLAEASSIEKIINNLHNDLLEAEYYLKGERLNYNHIINSLLNNKFVEETKNIKNVLEEISQGTSAILIDGFDKIIKCETKGFQIRNIKEPESEITIRGPRDGFVENIFTNTSLLRQRLKAPHLWIEGFELGKLSKTDVAIAYIKGLASEELIQEVKSRINKIEIDNLMESGYIEEYIRDEYLTIFPLVERTERPDKVVSCLVEGKVAILTNNTPFVLVLPTTYNMLLQTPDDYYEEFIIGSFMRLLRHMSYLISLLLPGLYVSIINYHAELVPIDLLLRISATREGVPFPLIIESLIMESIFEILREAGIRLPRAIGPAVSIVGALVLGEAAINAGLVSPPMVIIVSLTAIASFTTPNYPLASAARLLRYVFLILGGIMGLFGIKFGFLLLLIHLCSLRSFGQPYFQPFGPLILQDIKDSIIRFPLWVNITRLKLFGGRNPKRQTKKQKPQNPEEKRK